MRYVIVKFPHKNYVPVEGEQVFESDDLDDIARYLERPTAGFGFYVAYDFALGGGQVGSREIQG